MVEPHPRWVARGCWGEPTSYLLVRRRWDGVMTYECGNCGRQSVRQRDKACVYEPPVEGARFGGCGVYFTQITTPREHDRDYCEMVRPDLEYVVKQWC